jgi:hypothetical protein
LAFTRAVVAQEDKKTDDNKPADPDTGESTVEDESWKTIGRRLVKTWMTLAASAVAKQFHRVQTFTGFRSVATKRASISSNSVIRAQSLTTPSHLTLPWL